MNTDILISIYRIGKRKMHIPPQITIGVGAHIWNRSVRGMRTGTGTDRSQESSLLSFPSYIIKAKYAKLAKPAITPHLAMFDFVIAELVWVLLA